MKSVTQLRVNAKVFCELILWLLHAQHEERGVNSEHTCSVTMWKFNRKQMRMFM